MIPSKNIKGPTRRALLLFQDITVLRVLKIRPSGCVALVLGFISLLVLTSVGPVAVYAPPSHNEGCMDLAIELQKIYDSEINIAIGWFWDGGITLRLGDEMNGYLAEEIVPTVADIVPWIQEAIAHFYPTSEYATGLPDEIRERAANRLFQPPTVGQSVTCPFCGAPHAAPPGMDQLFQFWCPRCGNAVEVPQPKVQ